MSFSSTPGWAVKSKSPMQYGAGSDAKRSSPACLRAWTALTSAASSRSRTETSDRSSARAASSTPVNASAAAPSLQVARWVRSRW